MNLKTVAATVAAATVALTLSAGAAFAAPAVANSSAHVLDSASTFGTWIDTLYAGEVVDVVDCWSGWCYVDHAGPSGWVKKTRLNFGVPAPAPAPHVGLGFSVDGGGGFSFGFNVSSY